MVVEFLLVMVELTLVVVEVVHEVPHPIVGTVVTVVLE
jgi:hypothetical protein